MCAANAMLGLVLVCLRSVGVGEDVHRKHLEWTASERRRAARATEESVRHEEKTLRQKEIGELEEQFDRKKELLLRRCAEEQEEAVAVAVRELTTRLQEEEERRVALVRQEDAEKAKREAVLLKTHCEAEKEVAVRAAREDERAVARAEAERVAELVAEARRAASQLAEEDKQAALDQLAAALQEDHSRVLERRLLEAREAAAMDHQKVCACYEEKLSELRGSIWLLERDVEGLKARVAEGDVAQTELQCRYDDLRREFADFVNQVPGFRDDFIIK